MVVDSCSCPSAYLLWIAFQVLEALGAGWAGKATRDAGETRPSLDRAVRPRNRFKSMAALLVVLTHAHAPSPFFPRRPSLLPDLQAAILLLQRHERARQGRLRAKFMLVSSCLRKAVPAHSPTRGSWYRAFATKSAGRS
jgi:hypothetical protein